MNLVVRGEQRTKPPPTTTTFKLFDSLAMVSRCKLAIPSSLGTAELTSQYNYQLHSTREGTNTNLLHTKTYPLVNTFSLFATQLAPIGIFQFFEICSDPKRLRIVFSFQKNMLVRIFSFPKFTFAERFCEMVLN